MLWFVILVLAATAAVLLLRQPVLDWRRRRRARQQERKRDDRRRRRLAKQQRNPDRARNPAKAAARRGEPTWQQVAQRQGRKCWLCGRRVYADDRRWTAGGVEQFGATYPAVDYEVPIEQGGTYEASNCRLAHRHCRDLRRANPGRRDYGAPRRTFPTAT